MVRNKLNTDAEERNMKLKITKLHMWILNLWLFFRCFALIGCWVFLIKGWLPCVTFSFSCVSHPICGNYSVFILVYPICLYIFYSWVSTCCCCCFNVLPWTCLSDHSLSHTHTRLVHFSQIALVFSRRSERTGRSSILQPLCEIFKFFSRRPSARFCIEGLLLNPPCFYFVQSPHLFFQWVPSFAVSLQIVVFRVNGVYTFVVVASCASPVSSNMRACECVLVLRCCSVNFTFTPSAQLSQLFDRFCSTCLMYLLSILFFTRFNILWNVSLLSALLSLQVRNCMSCFCVLWRFQILIICIAWRIKTTWRNLLFPKHFGFHVDGTCQPPSPPPPPQPWRQWMRICLATPPWEE